MTKAELITTLVNRVGLTQRQAAELIAVVVNGLVEAISRAERVELRGFGSFRTRRRKARAGRDPRTGAQVQVPAKVVPHFKPSKRLREALGHR